MFRATNLEASAAARHLDIGKSRLYELPSVLEGSATNGTKFRGIREDIPILLNLPLLALPEILQ